MPSEFGMPAADGTDTPGRGAHVPSSPDLVMDSTISRPLAERMRTAGEQPIGVVIEVVTDYPGGVGAALATVEGLVLEVAPDSPVRVIDGYVGAALTADQIRRLVQADIGGEAAPEAGPATAPATPSRAPRWAVYRIWPNFQITALITRSIVTTKCDAARRAFDAAGRDIVWAVVDSGIDGNHPHFALHGNVDP